MIRAWRQTVLVSVLLLSGSLVLGQSKDDTTLASLRQGIVSLKVDVNPTAHSAATLGEHRAASGVVIDDKGLIVTVGYIILEASSVEITGPDGTTVPGSVVG